MRSLRRFLAARLDRGSYLGLHLTVGLGVAVLALWAFGALLEEVLDAERLVRWDQAAARWAHAHTTADGMRAMRALSAAGSPALMAALGVGGAIVLSWRRRRIAAAAWIAAFAGGALLDALLKAVVRRSRPPFGADYLHWHSFSFPSGHAMGSLIGYGMLLYALRGHMPTHRWVLAAVSAAVLVLAIGVSRFYLGVHYPSDILGGFAAGAAWLAVSVSGASVAHGRDMTRVTVAQGNAD